jgi:hypothetical protein
MDEFASLALWLLIIIFSINLSIIYLANTETFTTHYPELKLNIVNGTYFEDYSYSDTNSTIPNTVSSNPVTLSITFLANMANGIVKLFNTLLVLFGAWVNLLAVVLPESIGGGFFIAVLKPLFGIGSLVGILLLFLRGAGVIRGVL